MEGKTKAPAGVKRRTRIGPAQGQRKTASSPELARFKRILRRHLPELRERYKVKSLGLFGSYVHGEQRKRSDLDVLVEYSEVASLFEFIGLELYLSDLLGVKVDLVMKSGLKPHIGQNILREVIMV